MRVGIGYDSHRFADGGGRQLILGGVGIPHPQGLPGNSDAAVDAPTPTDAPPGPAGLGHLRGLFTALAAIESIFPPVPADTAVALGAFLAGRGVMNAWAVFLLTWVANVGSAAAVYGLGRRYGRDFFQGRLGRKLLPEPVLAHITAQYRRHGTSGIFLSRLLPVWRAVVPPFAGVAGVPPVRALVPLALASGLWYGGLTFFVATASANLQTVLAALGRVNSGLGAVALGVLIFLAVWTVRRLKR